MSVNMNTHNIPLGTPSSHCFTASDRSWQTTVTMAHRTQTLTYSRTGMLSKEAECLQSRGVEPRRLRLKHTHAQVKPDVSAGSLLNSGAKLRKRRQLQRNTSLHPITQASEFLFFCLFDQQVSEVPPTSSLIQLLQNVSLELTKEGTHSASRMLHKHTSSLFIQNLRHHDATGCSFHPNICRNVHVTNKCLSQHLFNPIFHLLMWLICYISCHKIHALWHNHFCVILLDHYLIV